MPRNRFARLGLALVISLASAGLAVASNDPADLLHYRQELRKAGDDLEARIQAHLTWVMAVLANEKAQLSTQKFPGIQEKFADAVADFRKLQAARGASDPEVKRLEALILEKKKLIIETLAFIKNAALGSVKMPADLYKGADKPEWIQLIKQTWQLRHPQDKILAIRFDQTQWKREKSKQWVENGDYFKHYDSSSMLVKVILEKDADVARLVPVFIQINHHDQNRKVVGGTGAEQEMLRKNVVL